MSAWLPTIEDLLGPAGRFLAVPAEDATRGFIEDATVDVLASPEFERSWIEANRVAHQQAVRVLRGDAEAVRIVDGKVALDLVPLISTVIAHISQSNPELFGGAIPVPEVTPDEVEQVASNLAGALGITLPPDFGQMPVFDAGALTNAQDVVELLDDTQVALWIIFGLAFVGALVASLDRRRTVAFLGVTTTVTGFVVWLVRRPLENDLLAAIENPTGKEAAQIVIEVALWRNLGPLIASLVVVAVVAAVVAFLIGPSRYAVAFRATVRGLFRGDQHDQTAASAFLRRHTAAFPILGAVAALIALLSIPRLTWGWIVTILVVLAAYEVSWAYVTPLPPQVSRPHPTETH